MPVQTRDIPEEDLEVNYVAFPTAREFHSSNAFVRGLRGPVGGGKTVACIMELYTRALEQKPHKGVRRSRWALIRNSYPELLSTTLKTFEDWIPRSICRVSQGVTLKGTLDVMLADGTRVVAEFLFLALDHEDDAKKLKSLELTGAFINEASEIRLPIFELLTSRVGRYPQRLRGGYTWRGIIMDTNPPDDTHWWYRFAEVEKPKGYEFFYQPPGLICIQPSAEESAKGVAPYYVPNDGTHGVPRAENIENLPGATDANPDGGFDYYMVMVAGKGPEWIKVFVMGEYGSIVTGKPVYTEYSDSVHLAKNELEPYRGVPILLAYDFGLTPACAIMQLSPRGQLRMLDEKVSEDMGIERFAEDIIKPMMLKLKYRGCKFFGVGDPAGGARSQADETTCFQMLQRKGLPTIAAPSNSPLIRREAVAYFLNRMTDGEPGFQMSPTCSFMRKGFLGGYHYRRMKVMGSDRYAESPDKNEFSHLHDAVQYGCSYYRSNSLEVADNNFGLDASQTRRQVVPASAAGWG